MVCGSDRADGLTMRFEQQVDGSVATEFDCGPTFLGYPDRLQGAVVAMLLDAGMTHCLFARDVASLTAKLNTRYHRAVMPGVPVVVRARIVETKAPLYYLGAQVVQDGDLCAAAKGTFWDSACGDLVHDTPADATGASEACLRPVTSQSRRRL